MVSQEKAKTIERALRISEVTGTEQQIRYLCERLESDEELLLQLIQGHGVAFGTSNNLVVEDIPLVEVRDNIGSVTIGNKKYELMTYVRNGAKIMRMTEFGSRGGAKAPIEMPLRTLLMVLVDMNLIREQ
jgi:hypothetical protein